MDTSKANKKICFIGTRGHFSATVFGLLIDQNISITQVIYASFPPAPGSQTNLSVTAPENRSPIEILANRHEIPINYITSVSSLNTLDLQQHEKPDFILVACFPYKLPKIITNWPNNDCLNIHPSKLPQYRGPDPIFWQLYNGERQLGVSLHQVTKNIDHGPIIVQREISLKDGDSRRKIEESLATIGVRLFLKKLDAGTDLQTISTQQDDLISSYNPLPKPENYIIFSDWSAKHAFNFIRGTNSPTGHYLVNTNAENHKIAAAIEFIENENLPVKTPILNDELFIQLSPGILRVSII